MSKNENAIENITKKSFGGLFPPWPPLIAVIMVIVTYFGASVVGEIFLVAYGKLQGWNWTEIGNWLTSSTYAQFANTVVVYGLMALAIYLFVQGYKVSLKAFGVVAPRLRDIGVALLGVPVYIMGYVVLLSVMTALFPSIDVEQQQQLGFQSTHTQIGLLMTFVSLVVLPPIVEELVMRGFLFTSLLKRWSFLPAAAVTSLIFAAAHLQFGSGAPLLWVAAIDTFMLSLVLCFMRFKTGSLWPGILLHGLKNFVAFLSIFVFNLV